MPTLQEQFGQVIKSRREASGISQETLAHKAGLHSTYISMLERAKRTPTLGVIQRIAIALETTMSSLMQDLERLSPSVWKGKRERKQRDS